MVKEKIFSSFGLMPKEDMLEVKPNFKQLQIGIPKESSFQENRVSLTPDSVGLLVANGHSVIIEKGAGDASNFSDKQYVDKGANIVYSKEEVFKASFILKIEPPTKSELDLMQRGQVLISAVQMSIQSSSYFKTLNDKKISAFGFEFIKDNQNKFPIVRSMSEIAGNTSLLIAGEYLSNVHHGKGLMLGGISGLLPTNVLVIGAGTVGEYACRTALGLGASVIVFDNSVSKLRRLQNNINQRISTSSIQPKALIKALKRADVVVSALQVGDGQVPCIVSEDMVMEMKKGAVVIDVSIDQGGSFETSQITTHKKPIFIKHDVIHYCVPNIASRVSRTASMAISNILTPILLMIAEEGGVEHTIRKYEYLRNGVYSFNGSLTNEILSRNFKLPFKDLDLIMSTR
ncbi:MAG: alanine dehydrogenase [Bacteroidota bacterium]|nr:alanine dehydrogenase [Bacteroidota bacterium]|tara:strand:- start:612 stop:1817 length:1206 start_codon:yes stop_codon:yes gene_type:complete